MISIMTENIWSDFSYSDKCVVYEKTVKWPVIGIYCYTNLMCYTRGYEEWLFPTGIWLVYGIMVYIQQAFLFAVAGGYTPEYGLLQVLIRQKHVYWKIAAPLEKVDHWNKFKFC